MSPAETTPLRTLCLEPIGWVHSGLNGRGQAPHQGPEAGLLSDIEVDPRWADGLTGLSPGQDLWVVGYLDQAGTPEVLVHPRRDPNRPVTGIFNTRAPLRPCPISLTLVRLEAVNGLRLTVRGLELLDGTPVLDLKPWLPGVDEPLSGS
ncbi:MAG: tRNA (N6-threonylcarbamoyladenosine(37)-N6)-methyltransferase TrmO [Deltaproteobacteria bacterium]|nr:tRNA (N6-threonylcarbamoyladenosine(37)-N6)-methyltransferase TrmO [Deltaproteobacteria bacterium]